MQSVIDLFAKKFGCDGERLGRFVEDCYTSNEDHGICGMGEHDIATDKKAYLFDGEPHNLESATCSDIECFLSQLGRNTIHRLDGTSVPIPDRTRGASAGTHTEYALAVMSRNKFMTLRDTSEILYYDGGVYRTGGETVINETAEGVVENCTTHMRNEIANTIRANTYVDRLVFDNDSDIINVQNGLYNIETGEFTPHDEDYPSRVQLNVVYDPDATCNKFDAFMEDILADETDRQTIFEMFGAVLVAKKINLEKILMMVGEGSNGKSTLLRTMVDVFGKLNCSFVSIHALESQRFAIAELDGKLANIYADISNYEMDHISAIKALVSGDPLNAEKKQKDPFIFENRARFFFSCNRLPEITEQSAGVYRRFRVVEFLQSFVNRSNPKLLQELTSAEEKSGILNILIHHAGIIARNGRLTHDVLPESVRREWHDRVNMIENFVGKFVGRKEGSFVPKNKMYGRYVEFCRRSDETPKTQQAFSIKMAALGYEWKKVRPSGDEKPINCWIDVFLDESNDTGGDLAGHLGGVSGGGKGPAETIERQESITGTGGVAGPVSVRDSDDASDSVFDTILDGLNSGSGATRDSMVLEMVKSGRWDKDSADSYIRGMVDAGHLVYGDGVYEAVRPEGRWYCDTCDAGPFVSGEVASGGRLIDDWHSGHRIRKL